jgi:hypothetical protein
VSADWVALTSVWEDSTSRPRRDGCSEVKASGEINVTTGACISYGGLWR